MEESASKGEGTHSCFLTFLAEAKKRLESIYGEKLVDVIPFGVGISGELFKVNFAVVLRRRGKVSEEKERILRMLKDLTKGKTIDVQVISQERLEFSNWPLYSQRKDRRKLLNN